MLTYFLSNRSEYWKKSNFAKRICRYYKFNYWKWPLFREQKVPSILSESCDYNYQNLQCLSNKGLPQFFLKMFLSNYRESQSYKLLVFLSVWPKYCLIFKSMFFFNKFRWTFAAIPFLYKIIQKHFEKK